MEVKLIQAMKNEHFNGIKAEECVISGNFESRCQKYSQNKNLD